MATIRKNKAKCLKLDDFGRGICYIDGQTTFVPDFLPGEEGVVETIFNYGKLVSARLVKRTTTSPDRVLPPCPYYDRCGGCQLQHLSYPKQLEYKRQKVKDNLHKFGGLDVEVEPTIGLDDPWAFRNKIQVPVGNRDKKLVAGFYQESTHKLVPIEKCLIESEIATKIRKDVLDVANSFHIQAYNENNRTGFLRHILIKVSEYYQEVMVVLVTATDQFYGANNFVKALLAKDSRIKTIVQNINTRATNVILGEKTRNIYGPGKIKDRLCDLDFLISAKSFYQTNLKLTETLYKKAIELAAIKPTDRVLDAYCGTGTIGLVASRLAKEVVGVEVEHSSIMDANLNKKINKIENIEFIEADCSDYLNQNCEPGAFDVIIMDPPRAGSTEKFIEAVKRIRPRTVIYVSCNPATLGRDLGLLKEFSIKSVYAFDMFSSSAHVETVCALSFKKSC